MFNKPSDCPIIFCFQDMEQMSYKFKRRVPTLGEFDCLPALSGDAAHLRTNQTVSQNEALLFLIFHSTRSIVFDFWPKKMNRHQMFVAVLSPFCIPRRHSLFEKWGGYDVPDELEEGGLKKKEKNPFSSVCNKTLFLTALVLSCVSFLLTSFASSQTLAPFSFVLGSSMFPSQYLGSSMFDTSLLPFNEKWRMKEEESPRAKSKCRIAKRFFFFLKHSDKACHLGKKQHMCTFLVCVCV